MARPGHYKQLTSSNPMLEVKRAGREHVCAGVSIERGNRPGRLKDVWIVGRSRRCVGKIKKYEFYIANRILPPFYLGDVPAWDQWVPTCMVCAIENYGEYIDGEARINYFRTLTPELKKMMQDGLVQILDDADLMRVA